MWSKSQTLLAVLLAAMGLAAWWQLRPEPSNGPPPAPRERSPDYVVTDFRAVEMDDTGKPSRQLVAAKLVQYVDEDRSVLERPRLTLYQPEGPPWQARARRGLLLKNGEEVRLFEDVHIDRAADDRQRPMHLETQMLAIWPKAEYAETDRPVRISSDGDWLTATGMELWYADPTYARFRGRAKGLVAPAEARP